MVRRAGSTLLLGGAIAFLVLPVVLVVLFSFHSSARLTLPFEGFSLRWYRTVFDGAEYGAAIRNSAIVAAATALATGILGTLAALGLVMAPRRLRAVLGMLFFAPAALPPLFVGLALLTVFVQLNVTLSLTTVVIGHVVFTFPYFVLVSVAALERLDPELHAVAADLGAGPWQRFTTVTLPLVWPILLAATVLTFAISFDEFIITFFVIGPESTVPLVLWSTLRRSIDPTINVLASLLLGVTLLGVLAAIAIGASRRKIQFRPTSTT